MEDIKTEGGDVAAAAAVAAKVNGGGSARARENASSGSLDTTPDGRSSGSPRSGSSMSADETKGGSDSVSTPDTAQPKVARKPTKGGAATATAPPAMFDHFPDVTAEACATFQVIPDCLYGSKHMGSTDNDALDCECREEWRHGVNQSCGEDDNCINRATKMECVVGSGNCSHGCQNQRFQRKQYASVTVIKTEKKGYGLRADADLSPHEFVFEYVGEVINEATFRRRMQQYDDEGIRHFYFMSLNKSEFVDATKRGNLGRFCNHSCRPNCYVDKWVVGEKLRMGIFAMRHVRAGEELVFNYNVDRYGADPQPCYCGEPSCSGFIGGKTQTGRATKLPLATIEALGIDDADGWDAGASRKPRRRRADENDEDYINSVQPRGLDEDGARKVMASLMQCKEKWIAVKLLERIQRCDDERAIHCVMRMHAYQILRTTLNTFAQDHNVVLQVLDILGRFPRLTRNKIQDSNIEATVQGLAASDDERVASGSRTLLEEWSKLEVGYRIKRRKLDANASVTNHHLYEERRGAAERDEEAATAVSATTTTTKSVSPLRHADNIPKGPRSSFPQRGPSFYGSGGPPRHRRPQPLPEGWKSTVDSHNGRTYYYNSQGVTSWQLPTQPAETGPKATPKAVKDQEIYKKIIDEVTREVTPRLSATHTPLAPSTPVKDPKRDKWRTLPVEKQMKIYENMLHPHIMHVVEKFKGKITKDELKRFAREISKKLVASDYKNKRVRDPTAPLDEKHQRKVKTYVKEFLDRAVVKQKDRDRVKDQEANPEGVNGINGAAATDTPTETALKAEDAIEDVAMSDMDGDSPDSTGRKRKRDPEAADTPDLTPPDGQSAKRAKDETPGDAEPPPPPPPPPTNPPEGEEAMTEEQLALKEQEEALMRENEEAERLDEEEKRRDSTQGGEGDVACVEANMLANGQSFKGNAALPTDLAVRKGLNGAEDEGGELETKRREREGKQRGVMSH